MPKLKTHSGAKKRLKVSKSGKIKFQHAGKRHLNEHKSAKRKRQARGAAHVHASFVPQMKQLLPGAF